MKLSKFGKFLIGLVTITCALVAMKGLSFGQGSGIGTLPNIACDSAGGQIYFTAGEQVLTDSWTWGGGITHTVSTTRRANESPDSFGKRHKEQVMSDLQIYPRDSVQHMMGGGTGRFGDYAQASWQWRPPIGGEMLTHTMRVQMVPGWQQEFRLLMIANLREFPRG